MGGGAVAASNSNIVIIRDTSLGDAALVANDRANLEDIACNADLYISNQEDLIQTDMFG